MFVASTPGLAGFGAATADRQTISAGVRAGSPLRVAAFFVLLVAAFVAAHGAIQVGIGRVRTSTFGVMNQVVEGRINAAVVITGSSRALNHYDPREITRATGATAWNIGLNGSQTDMQLALLRTYLQHNAAPQLLIHNIDSFAFVSSRSGLAFPETYVPYLNEPALYEALVGLDSSWATARRLPLYGYAVQDTRFSWLLGLTALLGRQPRETRFNGFEPRHTAWTEDFERFRAQHPNGVTFPRETSAVRDLEEIVAEATARGSKVLLVYSPVYFEMQSLDRSRAAVMDTVTSVASRHGALVWDFSDAPLARDRRLFYNSQHLNADGAQFFSVSLAQRLVESGLLRTDTSIARR